MGRKDKDTPEPTSAPSFVPSEVSVTEMPTTPSPSQQPTVEVTTAFPSKAPVTETPTKLPTATPSISPSLLPTERPSATPTVPPTPPDPVTAFPTFLRKTSFPSVSPSTAPSTLPVSSGVPTSLPTNPANDSTTLSPSTPQSLVPSLSADTPSFSTSPSAESNLGVTVTQELPTILFVLTNPNRSVSSATLQNQIDIFLTKIMRENIAPSHFESLEASYAYFQQENTAESTGTRQEVSMLVTGKLILKSTPLQNENDLFSQAFASSPTPSEEEIESSLLTFFKLYGWDDLENHLKTNVTGYSDVEILDITINGFPTRERVDPDRDKGGEKEEESDVSVPAGVIIGTIAGGLSLFCVTALVVFLVFQKKTQENNDKILSTHEKIALGEKLDTTYPAVPEEIDLEDESSQAASSIISSAVGDSRIIQAPRNNFYYDASRLDQVILSARKGLPPKNESDLLSL